MLKLVTELTVKTREKELKIRFHDGEGETTIDTIERKVSAHFDHNSPVGYWSQFFVEYKDDGPLYGEVIEREQYLLDEEGERYEVREEIKV